ncbi:mercuric transporter MerT family protein, partial [Acinetobacter baumannii]
MAQLTGKSSLLAGTLAAIGASVCCVGPLILLALGIGGSWIANLTAMEPYRPFFIGLTLLFLGLAFRQL